MARRPDRTNAAPGASHTLAPNTHAHPILGTTDRTDEPGRPGALLRPAPLRTGRACFHASGSSKPAGVDRLVVVRRNATSLRPFTANAAAHLSSGPHSAPL